MKDSIPNSSLLEKSLPTQGGLEGLFFELLQVAIGNRQALTSRPTDEEWEFLYDECDKHALLGIAFAGVERLPKEQYPPFDVLAEWVHDAQVAKENNEKRSKECVDVCNLLKENGIASCIIKGQSNIINYQSDSTDGLGMLRTCGDIDLWCLPDNNVRIAKGIADVVEFTRKYRLEHNQPDIPWHRVLYYHVEMDWDSGIEVELHYRPSYLNCFWRNARLQKWFENNRQFGINYSPEGFPIPTNSFNAVYQLLHVYKHLFEQGIGLRQILDYYFVLKALSQETPLVPLRRGKMRPPESPCVGGEVKDDILGGRTGAQTSPPMQGDLEGLIRSFGMKKFASAMMYVLRTVFAMPDKYLICKPNEEEGKFLLSEIMQAGNFGKYDERIKRVEGSYLKVQCNHALEKWKHNLRLIGHYPEEVLWEPVFRVYHWVWRRFRLWK
jgi:hypothetical protein